jgi:hypothetical protein
VTGSLAILAAVLVFAGLLFLLMRRPIKADQERAEEKRRDLPRD